MWHDDEPKDSTPPRSCAVLNVASPAKPSDIYPRRHEIRVGSDPINRLTHNRCCPQIDLSTPPTPFPIGGVT